jgi:signal transduction histidine kinase
MPDGTYLFDCWSDQNVFTTERVSFIVELAFKRPYPSGKIDNVFYDKLNYDGGILLVAGDMTETIQNFRLTVINTFLFMVGTYVALFIIVWFMSFKVLQPVKDTLTDQKRFISNASHELKTPLAVINASADVLKGQADEKWLNNIKNQTNRMNVLVNDMLSLAKLEEGTTVSKKENFDLSEEIVNCALPFEALSFENGARITYNIQENVRVTTDRNAVKLLVNILMDNACKYVNEQGKITISLSKKKNLVVFSVYNTGSSVPDQDSARIFERFYRADESRSRENGGSGLGLAIAKGLANKNKWKIYADSKQGVSMTITVLF